MRLPEVQAELIKVAKQITKLNKRIRELSSHIARRRPVKVAPRSSAKVTPAIVEGVKLLATQHPDWTQAKIGKKFNINVGRVSEILRGKRR